jgi:osmotically-inducible protein OsmY
MNYHNFRLYSLLASVLILTGCAAAAVTGVAAGTSVAADTRTTGTVIEDQSIEFKAGRAFSADKELDGKAHINTTSYNTVVLLTGEAPTEELRQRAVELARNIERVTHVHNEITIAAPSSLMSRSSDTVITSKVKTRLLADKDVSGLNIKVVTEKGVVYLMGLSSRRQSDRATELTRTTGGVQKVVKLFQYTD